MAKFEDFSELDFIDIIFLFDNHSKAGPLKQVS